MLPGSTGRFSITILCTDTVFGYRYLDGHAQRTDVTAVSLKSNENYGAAIYRHRSSTTILIVILIATTQIGDKNTKKNEKRKMQG